MIKYVVFDWDGTLADTYPVILGGYAQTFAAFGKKNPSEDEIKAATSKLQNKNIFSYFFEESQIPMAKEIYYDYIDKHHLDGLKTIDGAKEVLDFCIQNNITPLLITNKTGKYIKEEINHLGFEKYFKKVVYAGQFAHDKPHLGACMGLFDGNLPPSDEIVVIGDGASDVEVAKIYGAKSIIYQNKAKGDENIDHLIDAVKILKDLSQKNEEKNFFKNQYTTSDFIR